MSYNHYVLKIDSKDNINYGTSTNPLQIHLPNNTNSKIERIVLKNASIPNIFYNITSNNNVLKVDNNIIIFPIGRYNITELITEFNLQAVNIVMSFNSFLNKIVFTATSNIIFYANDSTIFNVIGLNENENFNIPIGTKTALYMPNLSGPRNIYVECSNFAQMNTLDSTGNYRSYIANIPVDVPYLSIIHYAYQELELDQIKRSQVYGQHLNIINIVLRDNEGNILDLQNAHYELNFKVTYSNDNILYE